MFLQSISLLLPVFTWGCRQWGDCALHRMCRRWFLDIEYGVVMVGGITWWIGPAAGSKLFLRCRWVDKECVKALRLWWEDNTSLSRKSSSWCGYRTLDSWRLLAVCRIQDLCWLCCKYVIYEVKSLVWKSKTKSLVSASLYERLWCNSWKHRLKKYFYSVYSWHVCVHPV